MCKNSDTFEFTSKIKFGIYRAFHRFGQAKFAHGGKVLGEPIFTTAPAASKNNARFKSGQNRLEKKSSRFVKLNP